LFVTCSEVSGTGYIAFAEIAAILFESGMNFDINQARASINTQKGTQNPDTRSDRIKEISKKAFEIIAAALSRLPLKSAVFTV